MSLVNHSHYMTMADLAIFNQGIWQYSKLEFPYSTFHLNRYFLGDHFHPILMLLAPFYWISSNASTLLILQPFIMLSAIIPIFKIAYINTKSLIFGFSCIFAYSLYLPLQFTLFYDFHEIVFVAPILAWSVFFLKVNKITHFNVSLLLLLFVKEEMGFLVSAVGLYLFLFDKRFRFHGLVWVFVGSIYSLIVMHVLIPQIGGNYLYFGYGKSGNTPAEVITSLLKNPQEIINIFTDSPIKIQTLKDTFRPYLFLPLISPFNLILSFEQFVTRFADHRNLIRWSTGYHYSAQMVIISVLGFIEAAGTIYSHSGKHKKFVILGISFLVAGMTRLEQINRSAVLLIKRPQFWAREEWMDHLDSAIKIVPETASVSTQNNVTPHLSSRKKIYFLDNMDKAEYIVIDLHEGQSDYNFFGVEQKKIAIDKISENVNNGTYEELLNKGSVYVLKNKKFK